MKAMDNRAIAFTNSIPKDILETVRREELGGRTLEGIEDSSPDDNARGILMDLDASTRQPAEGQAAGYR